MRRSQVRDFKGGVSVLRSQLWTIEIPGTYVQIQVRYAADACDGKAGSVALEGRPSAQQRRE